MVNLQDIHPLTDFLRNHRKHVERMKKARRPEILTINGKAALVVQDVKSYQALLDVVDRIEAIKGIRRGLESMREGKGRPAEEFFAELLKQYKLPDDE